MAPVTLAVIGAGGRGTGYAKYAHDHPEECSIVGVAEPRDWYRDNLVNKFDIPKDRTFTSWEDAAKADKFCDGVIIATQDAMHVGPAVAFAEKGYHILLEKPMAPTPEDCRTIVDAAMKHGVNLAVCHVMRYTAYTQKLKQVVESGRIGEVMSIQHLEPVGYWHQAHSFVRGNWRNETESSFMLLAKSCHDIDWLRHIMGRECERVHSFGGLTHLNKSGQPEGAADRCLDCPPAIEAACPYSAKKIYLGRVASGNPHWPTDVLTPEVTMESVEEALRDGPYGRCVYACDNDVVDHQVVNMEFDGGRTAGFTMTAFTQGSGRMTHIFGTRGHIYGDGKDIKVFDFLTDKTETIDTSATDHSILGGHGGGDSGIMKSFIDSVASGDPSAITTGPQVSLETHLMVFAAEKSRREGRVVELSEFS